MGRASTACTSTAVHLDAGRELGAEQHARTEQKRPAWRAIYKATRPKVERKLSHLMRRRHGGRRAGVRGTERVTREFQMLCAAENLRRLATLGLRHERRSAAGWAV